MMSAPQELSIAHSREKARGVRHPLSSVSQQEEETAKGAPRVRSLSAHPHRWFNPKKRTVT